MTISTKIDKNTSPKIDDEKLTEDEKNIIKIFKHILADNTSFIHYKRNSDDVVIRNETTKIYLSEKGSNITLYILHDYPIMMNITLDLSLYLRWLILRRSDINFKRTKEIITNKYSDEINNILTKIKK